MNYHPTCSFNLEIAWDVHAMKIMRFQTWQKICRLCLLEPCVAEWTVRFEDITGFVEIRWGREGTEPSNDSMWITWRRSNVSTLIFFWNEIPVDNGITLLDQWHQVWLCMERSYWTCQGGWKVVSCVMLWAYLYIDPKFHIGQIEFDFIEHARVAQILTQDLCHILCWYTISYG